MDLDQNRLSSLQQRLSMLRDGLETRRVSKFSQIMQRISELSNAVNAAASQNEENFRLITDRLKTLSESINRESKELEQVFEQKTQELEEARNSLQGQIQNLETARTDVSRNLIKEVEQVFAVLKEELATECLKRQDEAHGRQDVFDQDLPKLKTGLATEREQTKFQIAEIENKVKQVITALQQMLHQEKQVRTKWQQDLQGMITEVDKRLNADLLREKRDRESAEKQLISLLEQATVSYLQYDEDKL